MIRFGINKKQAVEAPTPEGTATDRYLQADTKVQVHKPRRGVRVVGNLLILAGLLMLLGIGGWYGYTQWNIQRDKDRFVEQFGPDAVDPPVVADAPTATPTMPPPLPALNNQDIGTSMLGVLTRLPQETDNTPPVHLS